MDLISILISDERKFKEKIIIGNKKGHFIII